MAKKWGLDTIMIKTLPDGTTVWIKWSNQNPNNPGGQHTNGPPDMWVKFNGNDTWLRGGSYESTLKVRNLIDIAMTKQDVLDVLNITDKIDSKK